MVVPVVTDFDVVQTAIFHFRIDWIFTSVRRDLLLRSISDWLCLETMPCACTTTIATMIVTRHWFELKRSLVWTCHKSHKKRTFLNNNSALYHYQYGRPVLQNGCPMSSQSVTISHPIRVFPIAYHNNLDRNLSCLKPLHIFSSPQRFFNRHHFAASNPIANLVNRQSRWNAKEMHKTMVARYGPNYRRRRPTVEKFPENMVKVEFMHSIDEIQSYHDRFNLISEKPKRTRIDEGHDADDTPGIFRVEWEKSSLLKLACDYYGVDCAGQLEYYNHETNNWKLILDDIHSDTEMIKLYKGKGNRTMPLRIQSEFDDGHISDVDVEVEKLAKGEEIEGAEAEAVRILLRRLVDKMRRERYVRISKTQLGRSRLHDHHKSTKDNITLTIINSENDDTTTPDNEQNHEDGDNASLDTDDMIIIPTKLWIIEEAERDEFLASLLLSRPGALRHLVQCVHWDRSWK